MRKIFAVLAITPVLVLSACGGSEQASGLGGPGSLLAAVDATKAEKTSKVDMTLSMSGVTGMPGEMELTGTGAFSYESGNGTLTMNIPAIAGPGTESTVETRVVDGFVYVRTAMADGSSPTPKPWMKVDVNKMAEASGLGSSPMSSASSDPTEGLEMLSKASSGEITEVGKETLRSDETTRYTMNIDPAKLGESEEAGSAEAAAQLASVYGNKPIPTEVWVDGSDRVRKMSLTIDLANITVPGSTPEAGAQPSGIMTVATEFYDFGTEVNAEAPPADQVMDITGEATDAAALDPAA